MAFVAAWVATAVTTAVGATGVVGSAVYATTYVATTLAITAGVNALTQAAIGTPDIETAKGSLKQAIPPRIRGYGRRRIGGYYMLWTSKANYAYDVIALHHGPIEAIEEVWLHDKVVALTGAKWVIGSPEYGGGNNNLIHVDWRLGLATETAYAPIVAALSGSGVWTNNHRGDGIASLGCDYRHAKKENLLDDFPQGDPKWGVTARLSPVWNPRVAGQERLNPLKPGYLHTASGNLAQQILDFCCHPDGMGMDYETEIAPALAHWMGEMDLCDEAIPLAAGGTEPRYHGSIYYSLAAEPQDTLNKLLAACDGRLLRDADGVTRLWVGKYREPTVWLTDDDIADYDIEGDAQAFDAYNEIVPTYVSEPHKWSLIEATPWRNEDDIALRGKVRSTPLALEAVNSASHARRLAKRESRRQVTPLRGTLVGKLSCVRATGQRWVGLDLADLELVGEVIEIEQGGQTSFAQRTVTLPFAKADPTADDWSTSDEDGSGDLPSPPPLEGTDPPEITSVTVFADMVAPGVEGLRLRVVGTGPDRDDLTWSIRWRVMGSTGWTTGEATDDAAGPTFEGDSGFVVADADLDVQLGFVTGGGTVLWSETEAVNTAPGAPLPATLLTADPLGGGEAAVSFRNSVSANFDRARILAGPAGSAIEDAIDITGDIYGAPSALVLMIITLSLGDQDIWVICEDSAGLASTPTGPVTVTIT